MTNWDNLWTLECNSKQEKFHVQQARERFNQNGMDYINSTENDWTMLGVFDSQSKASDFADSLYEMKHKTKRV
jgi:hypothetical protein